MARAFVLVRDIQTGDPTAAGELSRLRKLAEAKGWDAVERACLFGEVVMAWFARGQHLAAAIEALRQRSESDDDHVMVALALALRADGSPTGDGPFLAAAPDADLARAVVILEGEGGGVLERITAHTACGIAFGNRWLWELGNEQYTAALAIGAEQEPAALDFVLAPIAFNRCEDQVAWAGALRQLGDTGAVAERRRIFASSSAAVAEYGTPGPWSRELAALGTLLAAIAGEDVAGESREMLAALPSPPEGGVPAEPRSVGHLKLAVALSEANAGRSAAIEATEEAIGAIVPEDFPHMYDLALYLAVELETLRGPGAGLRCAKRQIARHWATRQARLGAMLARIEAERLSAEHSVLAREVNLDALTGIANRRALARYLDEFHYRDDKAIAVILVDFDEFKEINDRYGHGAGDAVLARVARMLEHNIRPADLAVRLGGDEFGMVLAGVGTDVARARAETLMTQIDQEPWGELRPGLRVTVSIGVAAGAVTDVQEVTAHADAALYRAKEAGGHGIVCSLAENPR